MRWLALALLVAACGPPAPSAAPAMPAANAVEPEADAGVPDATSPPEPEAVIKTWHEDGSISVSDDAAASSLPCGSLGKTPLSGELVALEGGGGTSRTTITINLGSNDGVTTAWGGVIVNAAGSPYPNPTFCIEAVKATTSTAHVQVPMDQVKSSTLAVRLYPP
jgi:hypothetical protein